MLKKRLFFFLCIFIFSSKTFSQTDSLDIMIGQMIMIGLEERQSIKKGDLPERRIKKKDQEVWDTLKELGVSNDEARQYQEIYKGNVFEDRTRGLVLLGDIIDSIMDGWRLVVDGGPLAKEPLMKSKFIIHDAKIHVDHMHRGPAQIYPAVRKGAFESMSGAGPALLEPIQKHQVEFCIS